MNLPIKFLAIMTMLLMVASCSSTKKTVASVPAQATAQQAKNVDADAAYNFEQLTASYGNWQRLKMPVTAIIAEPKSLSASGQVVMERNKSIHLSMRVLGMEVAALYLTADSVAVVDRWNKRYLSENLTRFLAGFPVNVANVQDLLTGRIFMLGSERVTADMARYFDFESEGRLWACKPKVATANVEYAFVCELLNLMATSVAVGDKAPVQMLAGEAETTAMGPIASFVRVATLVGGKRVDVTLQWKPSKAQWDKDVTVSTFKIPADYKRLEAADLIKGLSNK